MRQYMSFGKRVTSFNLVCTNGLTKKQVKRLCKISHYINVVQYEYGLIGQLHAGKDLKVKSVCYFRCVLFKPKPILLQAWANRVLKQLANGKKVKYDEVA